tara:strand:- start:67 stop:597 length:531 start_codon:yes stop_codon:yes gene_type:complete
MGSLQSLTVVELKEILRDQGKKVSGTKKELILRIEDGADEKYLSLDDDSTPVENTEPNSILKKQIPCKHCFQILNIPEEYVGNVKCPKCERSFTRNQQQAIESGSLTTPLLFLTAIAFVAAIISFLVYELEDSSSPYGGYGYVLFSFGSIAAGCFFGLLSLIAILVESQKETHSRP